MGGGRNYAQDGNGSCVLGTSGEDQDLSMYFL